MSRSAAPARWAFAVVALLAGAGLTGCGSTPAAIDATGPAPAPAMTRFTPSAPVVTVPALASPEGSATGSAEHPVTPDATDETSDTTAPATALPAASAAAPTVTTGSAVRPHAPTAAPTVPPPTTSSAPPKPVAVDLSRCAGCTVIAAHADVAGPLAAALARAPNGAVLLAARPDGSIAGVINVPYGVAFPAPAGGVLPCDASGRCFVAARGTDGNAVVSVFALSANGAWRDFTVSGGFRSATPVGATVDVTGDGLLDIAVQSPSVGGTAWHVFGWSGDGFVLLGCAAATGDALSVPATLSSSACSS